jgi:hypothetical protein
MPGPLPRLHGPPGGIASQTPLNKVVKTSTLPPRVKLLVPVTRRRQVTRPDTSVLGEERLRSMHLLATASPLAARILYQKCYHL